MAALRVFLITHRHLTMLLLVFAIALRALVPIGYMIEGGAKTITIAVCHDASGFGTARDVLIPMKDAGGVPGKPAKGECPYGALAMAGLGGVDLALLALALAFVMALGFAPRRAPRLARPAFLRPPLRGPPACC